MRAETDSQDEKPAGTIDEPGEESQEATSARTTAGVSDVRDFPGFQRPDQNWSKLPHAFIEALPIFKSESELKVVLYVLRHTWGFQEYGITKRITLDEFQHGRKLKDGSRMDSGTGLSSNAVKKGIRQAVAHGFLVQEAEAHRDKGRQSHVYCLRMSNSASRVSDFDTMGVKDRSPDDQGLTPTLSEFTPRSEKETTERNNGKKQEEKAAASVTCSEHNVLMKPRAKNGDRWYSHRLPDGGWCKGRPGDQPDHANDWRNSSEERRQKYASEGVMT